MVLGGKKWQCSTMPPTYTNRRRWTMEDARAALAALDSSGLSTCLFARRAGLDIQRLYYWRRRLSRMPSAPPAFIEVRHRTPSPVEVVLRSGRLVRVSDSIDPVVLRRLVTALDEDSSC